MPKFFLRPVILLLLVLTSAGAWAADYVFISNETNGYFIGSDAKATQTFSVETCVWSCYEAETDWWGNITYTASTLTNDNRCLRIGESTFLDGDNSNSGTVDIGTDRNNYWRANNNNLYYYRSSNRQVYRDGPDVKWNGSTNPFRVYSYTKTDENFTVAVITGVGDILTSTDTYNLSSAASYTPEYYKFTGPDTRYYASGYTTGAVAGTSPTNAGITTKTSGFTSDTWATTPATSGISINNSGQLTYTTQVTNDTQIKITHSITENGKTKTAEKTITLLGTTIATPTFTRIGNNVSLATTSIGATIHYTTDGSTPTASSPQYTSAIDLSSMTMPVTIKAIAVRNSNSSEVASATYSQLAAPKPVINISSGTVTITAEDGFTIYYTTDGNDPTTSSTQYEGKFAVTNQTTVKAIAVKDGYDNSAVASAEYVVSGISDGKVILYDYEDHNWTYYAGVSSDVDDGNYNTNYVGKMYSPDPRNVKITYKANGGAVSIDESDETEFVYYKTIEKVNNAYKYQVISNPFSKRPTGKGFGGWKITGGADYIKNKAANATLALDEEIEFENLPYPSVNCTSAEIELTATWVDATIVKNTTSGLSSSGTYETNIIVLSQNYSSGISPNYPCTIMMVEPDGSANYRTYTFTGSITPPSGGIAKIEHAKWNPNGAIAMAGRNLWVGRGVTCSGTTRSVTLAANNGTSINQVAKIESGSFTSLTHYSSTPSGITKQILVLGNDYDRANSVNDKLTFSGAFIVSNCNVGNNYQEACRVYSKSGSFMTKISISTAAKDYSYYMSRYATSGPKRSRYLEIEGGEWYANINGGQDNNGTAVDTDHDLFVFRMRGGKVRGCVYGAAEQTNSSGNRVMVFTGGQVGGWICGASNGISTSGGVLYGKTFVYFGGNAECNTKYQERTPAAIRNSLGGYVYGCGCGSSATSHVGEVTQGTNIVMADNAKVQYGVYGGGAYGYSSGTANVYVTGGHVESSYDASYNVYCGVYGGARQNDAGPTNVYMTGGLIEGNNHNGTQGGGLFGGSNAQGYLTGSVKMVVTGGQVGTTSQTANIHGGGYGANTTVSQNVDITLGLTDSEPDADGVTVYGDVYGGSALGSVNGNAATNTYHTNVTLNAGTINGSLYGGALGNSTTAANVYGPVQVKVYGGSVMNTDGTGANGSGAVYGANNINGAPQRSVTVDIYGTNSAPAEGKYALYSVYGGGNAANYTYGNGYPKVTVHNCDNSIEYVYGGGNAAAVAATDVTIYGGDKIGNVFGGGNGQVKAANVTGDTNVKIYGGTIGDVYGGSNTNGTIGGTISVNVNAQAESGKSACPIDIDNVYGGGNKAASNVGSITISCAEHIGAVYGGANQANITGNIDLKIESGHIDNVFGGNNNSGTISGTIKVTVDDNGSTCGMLVGNVYGGGNKAAYGSSATSNYPEVNIVKGHLTGNVFGGGLGATAVVTGNPQVNIGDWGNDDTHHVLIDGSVFGGGDAAAVEGNPSLTIRDCKTVIVKDVYGGGNAAPVYSTNLTIWGGSIGGNVFGGGNGERGADYAANVGYDRNNTVSSTASGNAVTNIYGGTFGVWNGDECTSGGGIFGGSNSHGNIKGEVQLRLDAINFTADEISKGATAGKECTLKLKEAYGAGNKAAFTGSGIKFSLGCVDALDEIYGGAKEADMTGDIHLKITSGQFKRVFGGNNVGGKIYGSIKVTVDETGCHPVIIDELYGCGHDAPYDVAWQTATTKVDPVVNIVSCTHIGQVFGGGLGTTAIVTGNPKVNINMIEGAFSNAINNKWNNKLGTIDNVYGGGNAAKVVGDTHVNIGTQTTVARADETEEDATVVGANISGNVYGGGNQADVTGKTHVQVGPKPTN